MTGTGSTGTCTLLASTSDSMIYMYIFENMVKELQLVKEESTPFFQLMFLLAVHLFIL